MCSVDRSLIGHKVKKTFGKKTYYGSVRSIDEDEGYFLVVYEDGDKEEYDITELSKILFKKVKECAEPQQPQVLRLAPIVATPTSVPNLSGSSNGIPTWSSSPEARPKRKGRGKAGKEGKEGKEGVAKRLRYDDTINHEMNTEEKNTIDSDDKKPAFERGGHTNSNNDKIIIA